MIKFVSDLSGLWFSPGTPVSSTNKSKTTFDFAVDDDKIGQKLTSK
jgi:hypothetical protein